MYAQTVRILSPATEFTMLSATPYIAMILFSLALTESRSINGPNPTITEGVHSRLKRMAIVVQLKRTNSGDKVDECTSAKTEYKDLTVMVQKMGLESDIIKWRNLILKQVNGFSLFFTKKTTSLRSFRLIYILQ